MKKILITLIALTLLSSTAFAQSYPSSTTLSASITATQTTITLASGTNVQAGGALFVDMEMLPIVSCAVAACTTVNVNRSGGRPAAHASGAVVTVVTALQKTNILLTHNGAIRSGQCSTSTSSSAATALAGIGFLPIIDIDTGDMYMCRRNGASGGWVWNKTNFQNINGTAGSVWTAWP